MPLYETPCSSRSRFHVFIHILAPPKTGKQSLMCWKRKCFAKRLEIKLNGTNLSMLFVLFSHLIKSRFSLMCLPSGLVRCLWETHTSQRFVWPTELGLKSEVTIETLLNLSASDMSVIGQRACSLTELQPATVCLQQGFGLKLLCAILR